MLPNTKYFFRAINIQLIAYYVILLFALSYYETSGVTTVKFDGYFYSALVLIMICFILIKKVKNGCATLILWIWFVWPVFGIAYAGSFNNLKNIWELSYNVSINFCEPLFIHYLFTAFFYAGVVWTE